jgi:hypothetical protein
MPLIRALAQLFGVPVDQLGRPRGSSRIRGPPLASYLQVCGDPIETISGRFVMGAYCTLTNVRRHPARLGESMEVRRLSPYHEAILFGDNDEIACIPHKGCLLEVVAAREAAHREVNRLLPGHIIRYSRSFFFGDRFELPSGTKVALTQLVGFRLQLAPPRTDLLPDEDRIVRRLKRAVPEAVELPTRQEEADAQVRVHV